MGEIKDKSLLENKEFLRELMVRMMTVNKFEEVAFWLFGEGLVHGTMHLSIGEEATGVGTTAAMTKDDYLLATHRGHGQALGKGVNVNAMMASSFSTLSPSFFNQRTMVPSVISMPFFGIQISVAIGSPPYNSSRTAASILAGVGNASASRMGLKGTGQYRPPTLLTGASR